jgi:hypothetical protein
VSTQTYFPEAPTIDQAIQVDLRPGAVFEANIRLQCAVTHSISGKIDDIVSPGREYKVRLLPQSSGDADTQELGRDLTVTERRFRIEGIASGSYTLELTGLGGASLFGRKSTPHLFARRQIIVGSRDLEELTIQTVAPATVRGYVRVAEGILDASHVHIRFTPAEPIRGLITPMEAEVGPDGAFVARDLDPTRYQIRVTVPGGMYLDSVKQNYQPVSGGILDLSNGGVELEVTLRPGAGRVEGTVVVDNQLSSSSGSSVAAGVFVLLSRTQALFADDGTVVGLRNGTFSLSSVRPGTYTAFAMERYDPDLWRDSLFLNQIASRGLKLDIEEDARKEITITQISEEEVIRAALTAGIISY